MAAPRSGRPSGARLGQAGVAAAGLLGALLLVQGCLGWCGLWCLGGLRARGPGPARHRPLRSVAAGAGGAPPSLEALLAPQARGGAGLPTRYKGSGFDAEACKDACAALASSIQAGNKEHVEDLMTALRLMMPPSFGSERALGPVRDDFILRPEVLSWGEMDFQDGLEENMRVLQQCEAEFATMMAACPEGFRAPELLAAGMDLAVAYLKNYALDKADALYAAMEPHCMARGLPWDVKFLQDLATLRCKQSRQAEGAVLLEEVAKRSPPHEATLRNLGTVYNQLREFDKAREYFDAAAEFVGGAEKEDLWNIGLVHKNKKNYEEAAPLLEQALEAWYRDDPEDAVTLAKLHDSVGSCYDEMGRHDDAVVQLREAQALYNRSIGAESPLYGSACERLAKALVHGGHHKEGLDVLIEAFTNFAMKDAVHPTPLFELLGVALEELPLTKGVDTMELARLEVPIEVAVRNMNYRGLDQDANAGVLFERMARALVLCSLARGDSEQQAAAARRRSMARTLLNHATPFVEAATRDGLADLTHVSQLIEAELQALDTQDALYRKALTTVQEMAALGSGTGPLER